jgi:hypothetical protein
VVAVLSFPFGFQPNGAVATVEQGSDEHNGQLLAALVMTRVGERHLVPGFGIVDPTFVGLDVAALEAATALYGPDVQISDVVTTITGPASQDVQIEFE